MPDTLYVALGVVIGALITGILNHLQSKNQFTRQKELDEKNFTRSKYEDIYKTVEELRDSYRKSVSFILVCLSRQKNLEFSESEKAFSNQEIKGRLKMLVALYAPALKDLLVDYNDIDTEYVKLVGDIGARQDFLDIDSIKLLSENLAQIEIKISKKLYSIESKLVELANEIK